MSKTRCHAWIDASHCSHHVSDTHVVSFPSLLTCRPYYGIEGHSMRRRSRRGLSLESKANLCGFPIDTHLHIWFKFLMGMYGTFSASLIYYTEFCPDAREHVGFMAWFFLLVALWAVVGFVHLDNRSSKQESNPIDIPPMPKSKPKRRHTWVAGEAQRDLNGLFAPHGQLPRRHSSRNLLAQTNPFIR